jgi:hypothetical protein
MGRGGQNLIYGEITPEASQARVQSGAGSDSEEEIFFSFFENKEQVKVLASITSMNKEIGIIMKKSIYNYLIEQVNGLGIADKKEIDKLQFNNDDSVGLRIALEKKKVSIKDAEDFMYDLAIMSDADRLNTWAADNVVLYDNDQEALDDFSNWSIEDQISTIPRKKIYTDQQWQEVMRAAQLAASSEVKKNSDRPGILKEAIEAAKKSEEEALAQKREALAERLYGNAFMKAIGDQRGLETISAYTNLSESEKDRYRALADQELKTSN